MGGRRGRSRLHCVLEKGQPSGTAGRPTTQLKPGTGTESHRCLLALGDQARTAITYQGREPYMDFSGEWHNLWMGTKGRQRGHNEETETASKRFPCSFTFP